MNDNTITHYVDTMVQCSDPTVTSEASYGDDQMSPASLINYWKSAGYKVFRNKEGTHIVAINSYYNGTIDGKSMSSYATGQVYTDVFKEGFVLPPTPDCKGGDANRPPMEQCGNSTVNMQSGRLSHGQELFATKSTQPLALNVSLYYRSIQFAPSAIGNGWSHSYEMSLQNGAGNSKVFWYQGTRRIYNNYNGTYISPRGDFSTLAKNGDNTFTITEKDGLKRNFDTAGTATTIVDCNGNTLTLTYTSGKLASVTDPNGRIATFAYDGNGKLYTVTDPKNNVYTFTYTSGSLTSVTHPDTGQWVYTYGTNGLMATKADPENNGVSYSYDTNNRMSSTTDPVGKSRSYGFPAPAANTGKIPDPYPVIVLPPKQLVFTEKDGNGWTYVYDTLTETIKSKTDPLNNTTSYTYDNQGNMLTKTEPGIGTTTYTYDAKGNILTLKDPLNQTTTYTYNSLNQVLTITGAPGNTTNTYDAKGNLLTTTDPSGALTQYGYDSKGNLTTITDARNKVTTLAYDAATNNLTSITLPTTGIIQFTYDADGNILTMTDAANKVTTYTYDSRNRLATVTDPLNKVTTYTYDKNGNPATQTDANNKVTTYTYDFQEQLTSVKDALNNITSFTYGIAGCPACTGVDQLTALTDAKTQKTSWTYDKLGRLTTEADPLTKTTSFAYGVTPSPSSKTDANNATTSYTYDNLQRLTQKTYPDTTTESYTYDSRNNILTATNANISYTFTYDGANRIKTATDNRGYSINYDYDGNGNRTKLALQPGTANERIINYTYDDGSSLATMTTPAGLFTFGYDLNNRRTSLAYPNQITATYSYDDSGRLTGLTHLRSDSSVVTSAGYTLDNVGNRTAKTGTSSETYTYDSTYRILQAVTPRGAENFTYDAVGNRLSGPGPRDTSYQHDAANRMTKGRQYTYTYDNNGNQLTRTTANPDKNWTLSWDYENRLAKMERIKGTEKRTITFKYDPFGRRIEKSLTSIIDGVTKTTTTTYVYDDEDIAIEITNDGTTTTTNRYIHGPGNDEPLVLERNGQFYFYHADGLGSVTAITDVSRNVVQRYTYDSFGNTRPTTSFQNNYQYTSRERDPETGLFYYRARYYDPVEGRFIQKDPIGFEGGVNVYNYTDNDPQNWTDPEGLDPRTPGGGINDTNPVTRCHVNPHNDPCENAIGGAAIGGSLVCLTVGPAFTGWRWMPNAKGFEKKWSDDFRTGWHRLPRGNYPGAGRNLPHFHRRPGIGKHRPWEGGW
ncbi:RHS repeat-associated core domain-containing protein [Geotalea sp. SG265]|uniref:RHS repeat-associated core domain-containing protein n=1 Tax=Geotalea sp. SG265 TaxID=2922867 RepID=UPI001FB01068|nr:RHS repeat-associated core domain-containing protein [Geotalea sp. SG265]